MSGTLGCTQNPNGTLKDAKDINFTYSQSPSPINLSISLPIQKSPIPPSNATTTLTQSTEVQKEPEHGKAPKLKVVNTHRRITAAVPVTKKRNTLTYTDKILILDFAEKEGCSWSQQKIADHFRHTHFPTLNQSTISIIFRNKEKLRAMKKDDPTQLVYKRPRVVKFPQLEDALQTWVFQALACNVRVTGAVLKAKAGHFADLFGIPEDQRLSLSNGWVDSFKQRYMLGQIKFFGEAASVSLEGVATAQVRMQELLSGYDRHDIYNMDETGLYYRMPPDRALAHKQLSGAKGDKTRITLAFTANTDGSDIRKPLFIGHARKPRCFNKKEGTRLGFYYFWNKSAWMRGSIFQIFLDDFDRDMRTQGRNVVLTVDNAPSHIFDESKLTNVKVVFFSPNMTSHIQPMDAGIIRTFKAHYRRLYILRVLDRDDQNIQDIYHIDQLEGMNLAIEAWSYVHSRTVANCWNHTKILGHTAQTGQPGPVTTTGTETHSSSDTSNSTTTMKDAGFNEAISGLQDALSAITGQNVASKNLPTVNELIDPEPERITEEIWTDEDIVEQIHLDSREEDGEHIQELDDAPHPAGSETQFVPPMSLPEACAALSRLHGLFQTCVGEDFEQARALLPRIRRALRKDINDSLEQADIRSFFTQQPM
ncbi:hypothetical protein M0805_002680 [Coniferiporia weirii]|nr:hypothetical protein M0805_002680 [Coniferiporia weirii]